MASRRKTVCARSAGAFPELLHGVPPRRVAAWRVQTSTKFSEPASHQGGISDGHGPTVARNKKRCRFRARFRPETFANLCEAVTP
jgi:hypothetical protein